jgi:hypothetical protein
MPFQFSDALDDTLMYERVETYGGGMDGFQRATLLAPDQWQYGENIVVPDNLEARTRPGADTLGATLGALIQGLFYFDKQGTQQLIAGAGTKLYAWAGAAWAEMNGANQLVLTDGNVRFAAAQGVDKVLFSDGTQQMQTWDGAAWSLPLGTIAGTAMSDPPVGATILCWHTARMFAAGKGSLSDTVWASKLLAYGTGDWDHVQFSFRVGGGEGDPILALASMQDYWLAVLKRNSVYLVNADPQATKATEWQISRVSQGVGIVGRDAWCPLGNDLLFMAHDGVRSVRRMQAAAGQFDLAPPISEPMQPYIDRINWTYASGIVAHSYKHLAFFAVPLDASTTNNYVLVFNARIGRWTGVFTGWAPNAFEVTRFNGVLQFAIGETSGKVRQWKDTEDADDDDTYTDDQVGYASKLHHRAFLFGEPVNDKDGYHCEARFSRSNALVTFTLVGDGQDLLTWDKDLRQTGTDLPVDLPFDLTSISNLLARRGLRGLTPFNEAYIKVESDTGWWALRNLTMSAYLNMLQNQ